MDATKHMKCPHLSLPLPTHTLSHLTFPSFACVSTYHSQILSLILSICKKNDLVGNNTHIMIVTLSHDVVLLIKSINTIHEELQNHTKRAITHHIMGESFLSMLNRSVYVVNPQLHLHPIFGIEFIHYIILVYTIIADMYHAFLFEFSRFIGTHWTPQNPLPSTHTHTHTFLLISLVLAFCFLVTGKLLTLCWKNHLVSCDIKSGIGLI